MMWQSNKWANISMGYKVINHFDTHETLRDHPTVLATGYHSPAISRKRTHELWTYNHHVTMVTRSTEKFRHLIWISCASWHKGNTGSLRNQWDFAAADICCHMSDVGYPALWFLWQIFEVNKFE